MICSATSLQQIHPSSEYLEVPLSVERKTSPAPPKRFVPLTAKAVTVVFSGKPEFTAVH
jgi:hypothetical protein